MQAGDALVKLLEAANAVPALPTDLSITASRKNLWMAKSSVWFIQNLRLWRRAYLGEREVLVDGRPNVQTDAFLGL